MSRPPLSELPIEELLRRARADEEGALEELFRRSQPALDAWAARRALPELQGGARPSDIVQDSALRAFEKFSTFKGNTEGEWFAWLNQVLRSQSVQLARGATRQKRGSPDTVPLDADEAQAVPAPQRSPSQVSSKQEEWRQLLAAFYRLPDDQREALSLAHLAELPVAEVALRMGKSKTAVDSLMQRGVRALRHRMARGTGEEPESSPEEAASRNAADAALLVYFRRREAREDVDPAAFAAEYPDCAEELQGLLHWLERLRVLRPPVPS